MNEKKKQIQIEDTSNSSAKEFMTPLSSGLDIDTRDQGWGGGRAKKETSLRERQKKNVKAMGKLWGQCSKIFGNELHSCFYKRTFLGKAHT